MYIRNNSGPRTNAYRTVKQFEGGRQKKVPPKRGYFATIGPYSVKTAADRYRHAAYHNKHYNDRFFLDLSTSMTFNLIVLFSVLPSQILKVWVPTSCTKILIYLPRSAYM